MSLQAIIEQAFEDRANISPMLYMGGVSAQVVLRSIPLEPPHYTKIGLPESVVRACIPRDGIVYVAGATGSGKSTAQNVTYVNNITLNADGGVMRRTTSHTTAQSARAEQDVLEALLGQLQAAKGVSQNG